MPARLVIVTLKNASAYNVIWKDDGRKWGEWQDPWYPSKLQTLNPGEEGTFRMESDGFMTGCEGWAYFMVDTPSIGDDPGTQFFTLEWCLPFWGGIGFTEPSSSSVSIHEFVPNQEVNTAIWFEGKISLPGTGGDHIQDMVASSSSPFAHPQAVFYGTVSTMWWTVIVRNRGNSEAVPRQSSSALSRNQPFQTSQLIDSPVERVWEAVTKKDWSGVRIESSWRVGSPIKFMQPRGEFYAESGTVIEHETHRRLTFTIRTAPCQDCIESLVTLLFLPHTRGTRLTVIHDRLPIGRGTRALHQFWSHQIAGMVEKVGRVSGYK